MYQTELEQQTNSRSNTLLQAECQWCGQLILLKKLQYHELKCQNQVQCTYCKKRVQMRLINGHEKYCQVKLRSDKKVEQKLQFQNKEHAKEVNSNNEEHKDKQNEQQQQLKYHLTKLTIEENQQQPLQQEHWSQCLDADDDIEKNLLHEQIDQSYKEEAHKQSQQKQEEQQQHQQGEVNIQDYFSQPISEINPNLPELTVHQEQELRHQRHQKQLKQKQLSQLTMSKLMLNIQSNSINTIDPTTTIADKSSINNNNNSKKQQQQQQQQCYQENCQQVKQPSKSDHHPWVQNQQQYRLQSGEVYFNNKPQDNTVPDASLNQPVAFEFNLNDLDNFHTPNTDRQKLLLAPYFPLEYEHQILYTNFEGFDKSELP